MNLKTRERPLTRSRIEGLQIETGGSVILSPFAEIPDECQPSNNKIFMVFGGAIATLLIGTAIGWGIATHFAQAATEKAQIEASAAKFILSQNQAQIDNFCKANSNLSRK